MKKKVLIILAIPLVLLIGAGTTVGLAWKGIIKVPFLPFGKKKGKPVEIPKDDGKGGPFASSMGRMMAQLTKDVERAEAEAKKPKPPPPKPVVPPPDPGPGEEKLAKLWAEVPVENLVQITEKWPTDQLGRILAKMDADACASLIAAVPPERAAVLSRAVADATSLNAGKVRADSEK